MTRCSAPSPSPWSWPPSRRAAPPTTRTPRPSTTAASAGTTAASPDTTGTSPDTTGTTPASGTLDWKPCKTQTRFDCATLDVPLDYNDPSGKTISLALIRKQAGDPSQRIGSLLMNPGGPGGSGVEFLPQVLFAIDSSISDRFDLVSFDPRGVGESDPIVCLTDQQKDTYAAFDAVPTPAEIPTLEDLNKQFGASCKAKYGDELCPLRHDRRRTRHGPHPRGGGRRQADLPRLLVRHPTRQRLRAALPRQGASPRARRCGRSRPRGDRLPSQASRRVRAGLRRLREGLRRQPAVPRRPRRRRSLRPAPEAGGHQADPRGPRQPRAHAGLPRVWRHRARSTRRSCGAPSPPACAKHSRATAASCCSWRTRSPAERTTARGTTSGTSTPP